MIETNEADTATVELPLVLEDKHSPSSLLKRDLDNLRAAIDQHALFSVTDHRGQIIDVNSGFCRISGYSREELIGANHRILNSGTHPKSFWKQMWKTISSGQTWRAEVCNRRKDGTYYWVDSTIVPEFAADGKLARYISIRFDISAQKKAQCGVDLFQEALDGSAGIATTDASGRLLEVNEGLCRMTGYSREELLSAGTILLSSENNPPELLQSIREKGAAGEVWHGELCNRTKDGADLWTDCTIVPCRGAGKAIDRFVTFRFDITHTRTNQLALLRAQTMLEQTGQLAKIGGWEIDLESKQIDWSDAVFQIHELPLGKAPTLEESIDFFLPHCRDKIRDAIEDAELFGGFWDLELPITTANGKLRWVRTIGLPQMEAGECKKLWGATQDVTEHHEAREQLIELTNRLKTATEGAGVGIWEYRANTFEYLWDRMTFALHDMEYGPNVDISAEVNQRILAEDRHSVQQEFMHAAVAGKG